MTPCRFKRVVALTLCLELVIAPLAGWAQVTTAPPPGDPAGPNFEITAEDLDPWATDGDFVEIYDGHDKPIATYLIGEGSLNRQIPAYSTLRPVVVDYKGQRCLGFEGTRGENNEGKNGKMVARYIKPKFCGVAAVAAHSKVLSIIGEDGQASWANYDYTRATMFKAPVLIQKNYVRVRTPDGQPRELRNKSVKLKYYTVGTRLTEGAEDLAREASPFPHDENGQAYIGVKDLIVEADGETVGVFDYEGIGQAIGEMETLVLLSGVWTKRTPEMVELGRKVLAYHEDQHAKYTERLREIENGRLSPAVGALVSTMQTEHFQAMGQSIERLMKDSRVPRDRPTLETARRWFGEIETNAQIIKPDATDEDLAVNWPLYQPKINQTVAQQDAVVNEAPAVQAARERKFYAKMAAVAAAGAALMATPMAIQNSPAAQRIGVVNWYYRRMPEVLKHASYTYPLIFSTISLSMLLPLIPILSNVSGKVLAAASKAAQTVDGPVAGKIRDMAKVWVDQENYQRITTFGYRMSAIAIISPFVRAVNQLLQQKDLLPALRMHVNPFAWYTPDSDVGRAAGLDRAMSVGFTGVLVPGIIRGIRRMNPFLNDPAAAAETMRRRDMKKRLQAEVYRRKQERMAHLSLLAGLAVAEHYKIDLATIYQIIEVARRENRPIAMTDLQALITDPRAAADWDLVTQALRLQIGKLPAALKSYLHDGGSREGMTEQELAEERAEASRIFTEHFEIARKAALNIKTFEKDHSVLTTLGKLGLKAARGTLAGVDYAVTQGVKESEYLSKEISTPPIFGTFMRGLIPDHLAVVLIPAVMNIPYIATRADMSNPSQLAAMSGKFLWTNPNHIQDVVFNDGMHAVVGTARTALQYQKDTGAEESWFAYREDVRNRVYQRNNEGKLTLDLPRKTGPTSEHFRGVLDQQTFGASLAQWFKSMNPAKADFGKQASDYLRAQIDTAWIYVGLNLASRMYFGHQGFEAAMTGLSLAWFLSPIAYSWWWWLIYPTNFTYEEHQAELQGKLDEGRRELAWGREQPLGSPARKAHFEKGVDVLHALWTKQFPMLPNTFAAYSPTLGTKTLEEKAEFWRDKAENTSPGGHPGQRAFVVGDHDRRRGGLDHHRGADVGVHHHRRAPDVGLRGPRGPGHGRVVPGVHERDGEEDLGRAHSQFPAQGARDVRRPAGPWRGTAAARDVNAPKSLPRRQ